MSLARADNCLCFAGTHPALFQRCGVVLYPGLYRFPPLFLCWWERACVWRGEQTHLSIGPFTVHKCCLVSWLVHGWMQCISLDSTVEAFQMSYCGSAQAVVVHPSVYVQCRRQLESALYFLLQLLLNSPPSPLPLKSYAGWNSSVGKKQSSPIGNSSWWEEAWKTHINFMFSAIWWENPGNVLIYNFNEAYRCDHGSSGKFKPGICYLPG